MVGEASGAAVVVGSDFRQLVAEHAATLDALQQFLVDSITQNRASLNLSPHELAHLAELVLDKACIARFFKKHKFNVAATQAALVAHIDWRLTHNLAQMCFETLSQRSVGYLQSGLVQFWRTDHRGMPVVQITPRHFVPSSDGSEIEDLRQSVIFALEIMRRWIHSLNTNDPSLTPASASSPTDTECPPLPASDLEPPQPTLFQVLIVLDVKGFGVSNMNYELLPLFVELFQKHFPQLVGQAIVLNYGWIHSGIWSVVRTGLTADATARLRFISNDELDQFIPKANIPSAFGGTNTMSSVSPFICPIISTFGSTVPPVHQTPLHARMLAQLSSDEDLVPDVDRDEDPGYDPQSRAQSPLFTIGETGTDIWHDARSTFSYSSSAAALHDSNSALAAGQPPQMIRSAADLQALLRVQEFRSGSGLNRTPSTRSLTGLTGFASLRMTALGDVTPKNQPKLLTQRVPRPLLGAPYLRLLVILVACALLARRLIAARRAPRAIAA
nr:hypothetical protein HK105_004344 [Polyrhizophydium stewartii]